MGASARGDRPGLLIPDWITAHDLTTIEYIDLGMYLTVAMPSSFHEVDELRA